MPPPLSQLVTVLDDFLDESAFRELQTAVLGLPTYLPAYDEGFVRRLGDTPPMLSKEIYQSTAAQSTTAFDALTRRLHGHGFAGLQIVDFSVRLQAAPAGSCLSMHSDGDDPLSGGYAFYLNEIWDPHWGGLLIAFDPNAFRGQKESAQLRATDHHEALCDTAVNFAITPRRNRLVLLRNPVRHMVTQILPAAGAHVRLACTGYFRLRAG